MAPRQPILTTMTIAHLKSYIIETKMKSYFLLGRPIFFKEKFLNSIDLDNVLEELETVIPEKFLYGIDSIIVGSHPDFELKQTNAKLEDGTIYVSHDQDDEEDLIDDIIHEIGHNVEDLYGDTLYGDDRVEVEFLGKRKRLFRALKQEFGGEISNMGPQFMNVEYSEDFDDILYQLIGYPLLTTMTTGLFVTPYSVTSLREYFATAFEEFFLKDRGHVKSVSPAIYQKIIDIITEE